ncbi:MAG: hypothetical protein E6772_15810 [Dysgonomonas sp.]|nr:hypothetical protein [Dysgonomonas sp.]
MRRKKLGLFLWGVMFTVNYTYAQVGINTEKPQTTLDINGDFQIRGEFRAGTDTNDEIAAGKSGQYLISQGAGLPPKWGDAGNGPSLSTGDYILRDTQFAEDRIGLMITGVNSPIITEGELLSSDWSVLHGLSTSITTTNSKNRIMFTTQTVVQSPFANDGSSTDWSSILCGIFIGAKGAAHNTFKLLGVRQGYIKSGHYPQLAFFQTSSYDDLPIGQYDVLVAYMRIDGTTSHTDLPLYVGRGFDTGTGVEVANNFMNKSVIRVDVFEP